MGEGDEGNKKLISLQIQLVLGLLGILCLSFFVCFKCNLTCLFVKEAMPTYTFFFTVFCCLRLFICLFVCLCHCHYHCQMLDVASYWQALISCGSMGINKSESTAFLLQKCKQKQWRIQDQVRW